MAKPAPRKQPVALTGEQYRRARALFLAERLPIREIARAIGAPYQTVYAVARRELWHLIRATAETPEERRDRIARADRLQEDVASLGWEAQRIGLERLVLSLTEAEPGELPALLRHLPSLEALQRVARTAQGRAVTIPAAAEALVEGHLSLLDRMRLAGGEPPATEPFPGDPEDGGAPGAP